MTLRDPEVCPKGHTDTYRLETRNRKAGILYRRHRCKVCGARWTSYQSLLNPARVRIHPATR